MTFVRSSALIATVYLALSARALPRPAPTYQVVDVGGPSSDAAVETIYSTITESQATVTVTASAKAVKTHSVTTTKISSVVPDSELPAYSHSSGSPPLPTLDAPVEAPTTTATTTATGTSTVYDTVPVAPYAIQSTSSKALKTSSSSQASSTAKHHSLKASSSAKHHSSKASSSPKPSSLKAAFTAGSQWNHTVTAISGPTSAGTGTAVKVAAHATGSTHSKRWFAATGTGAYLAGRAVPTGTGAYLAGRAAPTGSGAYLSGQAASTGYLNAAEGWNATSYYYASNDRLA